MRLSIDLTGPAEARFKGMLEANPQLGTAPLVKAMFSAIFGPEFLTTTPLVNDAIADAKVAALVMSWSLLGQRPNLVGPDGVGTVAISAPQEKAETLPSPPAEVKVDPRVFTMHVLESPCINPTISPWFFQALEDANASLVADQAEVVFLAPRPHDVVFAGAGETTLVNLYSLGRCFNFTIATTENQVNDVPYIDITKARAFVKEITAVQGQPSEAISAAMGVIGAMLKHTKAVKNNFLPLRGLVTLGGMLGHDIVWNDPTKALV
jgi:hypothetical protein